jgi:poly(A) polymerase Pap1
MISDDLSLLDTSILRNLDEQSVRSLNGMSYLCKGMIYRKVS